MAGDGDDGDERRPPGHASHVAASPHAAGHGRHGAVRVVKWMKINAWTVLAAATLVQACSGLAYSFSVYSEDLRRVYPRQSDVDLLGSMKDLGAYCGVFGGLLYDLCGPRVTLLVGALFHVSGYLGVWAVLTGRGGFKTPPPLWQTGTIIAVAANGNSFFDTAALLTSMHNFPAEKGVVAGLLKSYLGLSSALFGQLYDAFIAEGSGDRAAAFVVLCAVGGGGVAVLMTPLIKRVEATKSGNGGGAREDGETLDVRAAGDARFNASQFRRLSGGVGVLVLAVVVAATLNDQDLMGATLPRWVNVGLTAMVLLALLAPWWLLSASGALRGGSGVMRRDNTERARARRGVGYEDDALSRGLLGEEERLEYAEREPRASMSDSGTLHVATVDLGGVIVRDDAGGMVVDDLTHWSPADDRGPPPLTGQSATSLTLLGSLRSIEFWLLFATLAVSSGAAMTLVNNMDAIAEAVGSYGSTVSVLVSVLSVFNCLGRLGGGAASEGMVYAGLPRPAFLVLAQMAVAAGTGILVVSPDEGGLFTATALVGLALGAHWAFLPSACAEIFGPDHIGGLYGGLSLSPMLGSFVMSTKVFGHLYDLAVAAAAAGSDEGLNAAAHDAAAAAKVSCDGPACFKRAMFICALTAMGSTVLTVALCLRTSHVYAYHRRRLLRDTKVSAAATSNASP